MSVCVSSICHVSVIAAILFTSQVEKHIVENKVQSPIGTHTLNYRWQYGIRYQIISGVAKNPLAAAAIIIINNQSVPQRECVTW